MAGQQVGASLDTVGVGIDLQVVQLRVVQSLEGNRGCFCDLYLLGGIHQRVDLFIGVAHCHQITGGGCLIRSKGCLTVFVGDSAGDSSGGSGGKVDPSQLQTLHAASGGFQVGGGFIAIALHNVETFDGNCDRLAISYKCGCFDPGVVVGVSNVILHDIEVQHITVYDFGVGGESTIVAAARGGRCTVIGITLVQVEAAGVGGNAENGGDPTVAANFQHIRSSFFRKAVAEYQLMGFYQRVQRRNTVYAVSVAVVLSNVGINLHSGDPMEIAAGHLGTDRHISGFNGRLTMGSLYCNGIGSRYDSRGRVFSSGSFLRIADAEHQYSVILNGDGRTAAIAGAASCNIDLIILVGCLRSDF